MKIGTKSLLFGVHQILIHPWFVAWAWWKLYGFPWDPRLWIAFLVHDWGYWGKPNMDGPEGETHVHLGARIMGLLFDRPSNYKDKGCPFYCSDGLSSWWAFTAYHSRFHAKHTGSQFSPLCVADKLAIALTPQWLYLIQSNLTGEINEYMKGRDARTPARGRSQREWFSDVQAYCQAWAYEHRDCEKEDKWTGTKSDLAIGASKK
jgi:hypothetical protein